MVLADALPIETRLSLALLNRHPSDVAFLFGRFVGQFYDRERFDELARCAAGLYGKYSARNAARFRGRLDRLLEERDERPILWAETHG